MCRAPRPRGLLGAGHVGAFFVQPDAAFNPIPAQNNATDKWQCGRCTLMNSAVIGICGACSFPRPKNISPVKSSSPKPKKKSKEPLPFWQDRPEYQEQMQKKMKPKFEVKQAKVDSWFKSEWTASKTRQSSFVEMCKEGDLTRVKDMLRYNRIDQLCVYCQNRTGLMVACEQGHIEIVNFLIENEADIEAVDFRGTTALIFAVLGGHVPCVRALVDAGANCKHKNKSGRMASDYAKGEEILELLLGGDEELAAMEEVNLTDLDESTMMKIRDENAYAKHLANVKAKGLKCPDCKGTGEVETKMGNVVMFVDDCEKCEGEGFWAEFVEEEELCGICYSDPPKWGISPQCDHFFCADCVGGTLNAICETNQFPAFCPICRAENGGKEPKKGAITNLGLKFLVSKKVLTEYFMRRFLALQVNNAGDLEGGEVYFRCPKKTCGKWILDRNETDAEEMERRQCQHCFTQICMTCHEIFEHGHNCVGRELRELEEEVDHASVALMNQIAKKCPLCGFFVEKNGGCDFMMCGNDSHGSVVQALKNGGCGFQFNWNTLEPVNTFYNDIFGVRQNAFQKENLRALYKNTDDPKILKILRDNKIVL